MAHIRGPLAFWALAGVALLVSHDAIFLAQMGPGEELTRALRQAGHDYWGLASLVLAALGIAAAIATVIRLLSLRRHVAELAGARGGRNRDGRFGRSLALWSRLFALVAIGFCLQENVEHLVVHGHVPGLGALVGPEYPLALPVIGVITAIAASIAAGLRGAEQDLLAAIAAALQSFGHAPRRIARPLACLLPRRMSPMAHAIAGRAPPSPLHLPSRT